MSNAPADLVQRRTRNAFREHCVAFAVVRQIERCFEDEGLDPGNDDGDWWRDGQRRGVFDQWTANVDWTSPPDVRNYGLYRHTPRGNVASAGLGPRLSDRFDERSQCISEP